MVCGMRERERASGCFQAKSKAVNFTRLTYFSGEKMMDRSPVWWLFQNHQRTVPNLAATKSNLDGKIEFSFDADSESTTRTGRTRSAFGGMLSWRVLICSAPVDSVVVSTAFSMGTQTDSKRGVEEAVDAGTECSSNQAITVSANSLHALNWIPVTSMRILVVFTDNWYWGRKKMMTIITVLRAQFVYGKCEARVNVPMTVWYFYCMLIGENRQKNAKTFTHYASIAFRLIN